jgi:uncharacterized protein DUF4145
MVTGTNWTCPYCNRPQVVMPPQFTQISQQLDLKSHRFGEDVGLLGFAVACSNPDCGEIVLKMDFVGGKWEYSHSAQEYQFTNQVTYERHKLRPSHHTKRQPDYIPQPLRDDYLEACKIRDLSPKASATLARRCLQGMIRDFCNISKKTLSKEIEELRSRVKKGKGPQSVSSESVDAIDHVRTIGNIGAHMEADINVIIDVDAGEAQVLIELIESLFDEWYVERQQRVDRFAKLGAIADEKRAMKKCPQPAQAVPEVEEKKA